MIGRNHWSLGAKLALVATPFLMLALAAIAATLWVSWQLDGGAAAVNEAGRMRMQAYRMSLSVSSAQTHRLAAQAQEFTGSLTLLEHGDPERPLFVPWNDAVRQSFAMVQSDWRGYRSRWVVGAAGSMDQLHTDTRLFVDHIDALVQGIESNMSRWTAILHLAQIATMALAGLGAVVLMYLGYLFVLEPLGFLKRAIERMQHGDFSARVERVSSDEFGTLAEGFNGMAEHVQSMHHHLEARVLEKTSELQEKRERLEALYDVTTLVTSATSLQDLTNGFVRRIRPVAKADAVALRWSDQANERYLMLASEGLSTQMLAAESCLQAGDCHCGSADASATLRVIPIHTLKSAKLPHCARAGFQTIVSIPIRQREHLMGEVDLFYHAQYEVSVSERSLLEALTAHLAAAMENIRLDGLEKEAAISQERSFLARELHDSIAQSLAFLKIQVQLMRDALNRHDPQQSRQVLEEIDVGVRESYADVRELLVHFRTRANAEDIEPALKTTLRKFEHQSGLVAVLQIDGNGMPLAPDVQVQVLHIVQEALSNVRKHANASQVWLDVQQQPRWRFEIRDDGDGFADIAGAVDETHVGLRIMRERAERIGAQFAFHSTLGRGTSVILTLAQALQPLQTSQPAHAPTPSPDSASVAPTLA